MSRDVQSLPLGWVLGRIADTGRYINGFAFKPEHWFGHGRPIIRIQNLTDPTRDLNRTTFAAPKDVEVEPGEILVSWSATLDAYLWNGEPAFLNQHIFRVIPNEKLVTSKFLFYLLKEAIWEMTQSEHLHGSTMRHINRGPFMAFPVPIAPRNEQERIVAEIEKQFTRLDVAVAALKRVQANLKRYRAAVLKAACEGRLVPTEAELARREGRPYEPASELLNRIRVGPDSLSFEIQPGDFQEVAKGWTWTTLSRLVSDGPQNGLYLPKGKYGRGTPILRIDDFQSHFSRPSSDLRLVAANKEEVETYSLESGDMIVNRVNSPSHLGKALYVEERNLPALFESNMMRIRLVESVSTQYVVIYLTSVEGRSKLTSRAKWAVNQASINQEDVLLTAIPLPPAKEQNRIVSEVRRRLSVIEELEVQVEANARRADRLRQAILKRAFEGDLVPQDPNDEPAGLLLERIGREKNNAIKAATPKRRGRREAAHVA
jgi:type I restriction enzyme S subunit